VKKSVTYKSIFIEVEIILYFRFLLHADNFSDADNLRIEPNLSMYACCSMTEETNLIDKCNLGRIDRHPDEDSKYQKKKKLLMSVIHRCYE
jgi:hypothetical protein